MSLRSVTLLDELLALCSRTMTDCPSSKSEEKSGESIPTRVLSVQSTVVFGYVGNKAAMPVLQLHGFDVSPLNTVQFSNHVGYSHIKGSVTSKQEMKDLIQGLELNGLDHFDGLISGYMGSLDCLSELPSIIRNLKNKLDTSSLFYVCDPVMGDNGSLYSDSFSPFPEIYRTQLIPLAQLITPNQTEAGILLGKKVTTLEDCCHACMDFHSMGVRFVVITSAELKKEESSESESKKDRMLDVVFSDKEESGRVGHLRVPQMDAYVSGTGDMTSALLYCWLLKSGLSLTEAVENTMATMQSIIARTLRLKSKELILCSADSFSDILKPKVLHRSHIVTVSEP